MSELYYRVLFQNKINDGRNRERKEKTRGERDWGGRKEQGKRKIEQKRISLELSRPAKKPVPKGRIKLPEWDKGRAFSNRGHSVKGHRDGCKSHTLVHMLVKM